MTDTPAVAPAHATPPNPEDRIKSLLGASSQQPWYLRKGTWLLAGALALAAGGGLWWRSHALANAAPSYSTQAASRGDLTLTISANGTLQPTRSINIGSELSGTVLEVRADVNDRVKKGQILVVLDGAKLRDQVARSAAVLAASTARVALSLATLEETRSGLARLEAVAAVSQGQVPAQSEMDSARAALARAGADHASALAGVSESRAALSLDQINLSKASIAAPADALVLTRSVEPGNAVAASLQAVTLFTLAEDLARLRLWLYVDEADVSAVMPGQEASFTVSAYPSRKFPARITRVGYGSTITDNVVTYLTYLDVSNDDLSLRPGMTASASIAARTRKNVVLVPNTALRFSPQSAAGAAALAAAKGGTLANMGPHIPGANRRSAAQNASTATAKEVWVLREGQAVSVSVVTGISDGHMTEVTGGDLKLGMLVITDQKSKASP